MQVLRDPAMHRVIVFTRTKHGANRVSEHLEKAGTRAAAIHGNKSQNARQAALESFRSGETRVLVATDIAARGIDVDDISHVVNYELPADSESYVHRIGRTARAGRAGIAYSFCDPSERGALKDIERLIKKPIKVAEPIQGLDVDSKPERGPRHPHQVEQRRPSNQKKRPRRPMHSRAAA